MIKIHKLKTDPQLFGMSWSGCKPWEIRFDDRDFKSGDELILVETKYSGKEMIEGKPLEYTGRQITRRVDYILTGGYGLDNGWVVMTVSVI